MTMNDTQFIYCFHVPQDPELRIYVGKTSNPSKRFKDHIRDALSSDKKKNSHKVNWLRKWILKNECEIEFVILETTTADVIDEAERFYISYFRSLGFILLNGTDGGDFGALCGESLARLKETWNEPGKRAQHGIVVKQMWARPGMKEKMSKTAQDIQNDPDHVIKKSLAIKLALERKRGGRPKKVYIPRPRKKAEK